MLEPTILILSNREGSNLTHRSLKVDSSDARVWVFVSQHYLEPDTDMVQVSGVIGVTDPPWIDDYDELLLGYLILL